MTTTYIIVDGDGTQFGGISTSEVEIKRIAQSTANDLGRPVWYQGDDYEVDHRGDPIDGTGTEVEVKPEVEVLVALAVEAIRTAQAEWITHDWAMSDEDLGDREPTEAEREEVESDARAASELGDEAIVALEAGEMAKARKLIEDAAAIERHYGDDPAWAPALKAVKAIS